MSSSERSLSRGRGLQSTGRGGQGNFRAPSVDRVDSGPDDFSKPRGREPVPTGDPDVRISTGRGGTGNIRSPSRDPVRGDNASAGVSPARSDDRGRTSDRETTISFDVAHEADVHSFGRGGAGNMTRSPSRPDSESRSRSREHIVNIIGRSSKSKSRSRSREPAVHAAGRGGAGNMVLGGPSEKDIQELDESERSSFSHELGVHSVHRGGYGNFTPGELPYSEGPVNPHGANHPHATHGHLVETYGRGGSGNIATIA